MKKLAMVLAIVGAIFVLSACSKKLTFVIDNPTSELINIKIDDQIYTIEPNSDHKLMLSAGQHTLETDTIGKQNFIVYAQMDGGLINPTLSDYIMVTERYFTKEVIDSGRDLRSQYKKEITLDGVPFEGEYDHYHGLFIDKKWSIGVHENFPDTVKEYNTSSLNNTVRAKLFTMDAFISYAEGDNYQGYFEENRLHSPPRTYQPVDLLESIPVFDDENIANKYEPLLVLSKQYLLADTPAKQKNTNKAISAMLNDMVSTIDYTNDIDSKAWSEITDFISRLYVSAYAYPQP